MRRFLTILMGLAALTIAGNGHAQNGIVSIDNVTNEYSSTRLLAGNTHVVSINYDYTALSAANFWNGGNAFEIYSPDGADWGYLQGAVGGVVTDAIPDGMGYPVFYTFRKHFFYDGSDWTVTGGNGIDPAPGSDGANTRAGFFLATISVMNFNGATGGVTNGTAVTLEFTTDPADADMGKHICIDTCSTITSWEWVSASQGDFPQWDNGLGESGPRCWELTHDHCCEGMVGNANGSGDDEPTLGDIAIMVDAKFISGTCDGLIDCLAEADINQSGGFEPTCDDVTIGDVTILIDYLFISGPSLGLNNCF